MAEKSKKNKVTCAGMLWLPLVAGALALAMLFAVVTRRDMTKMERAADETLDFIRSSCEKYSNYRLGAQTAELEDALDKAKAFKLYMTAGGATDSKTMQTYLKEQELDGVLVLDSTLLPVVDASRSRTDAYDMWRAVLRDENVTNILQNPQKSFLKSEEVGGTAYDYAVIARPNGAGLILCYCESALVHPDEAEFSMNTLLSGYTFRLDGVAVVTDGENVLCSNEPNMQNRRVSALWEMAEGEELKKTDGVITIRHAGEFWYGYQSKYKTWKIYTFFPTHGIHSGRGTVMAYGIVLYVIFWLIFLLLRHHSLTSNVREIEKQYRIINAISSAYTSCITIHLNEDKWEPVHLSEHLQKLLLDEPSADKMLKITTDVRITPAYREDYRRFVDRSTMETRLAGKRSLGCDYENVEGEYFYAMLVPQKFDADGHLTAVLMLTRNVSEEKQRELDYQEQLRRTAEQAKRANVAKTDFLRRMSHDIRTPINGIRGMVEISRHYSGDSKKQAECLNKIMDASGFLLDLVNDVLDMNKLESGEVKLENRPFDLRQLMHETAELTAQQAREAGLTFTAEPMNCVHERLIGSPLHLRQIVQNVLSNAVKYNRPNGTIHVSCRETGEEDGKAVYTFTCADTGIGMSEKFQKHIYEPFAQENNAARTNYQGTGLGMAIVKELVEQMGGTITFTSKQGVGTTFVMTMALRIDTSAPAAVPAETQPESGVQSIKGARILLAEDNALNMEIAQFLLQSAGAELTCVWDGKQAVDTFAEKPQNSFDVILMDVMMPVMDGLEAARTIRAMDRPDAKSIPIIAMTANAFADDVERSLEAGINEHLSKPIDADKVIKTIAKYLHKA